MRRLPLLLKRLTRDTRAATVVEYGMIVALVVLAMFGALATVGRQTTSMWNNVSTQVLAH